MAKPSATAVTCTAAVVWKSGEPVKVEQIQVDPPKASEVRIKMICASLCHTDILCCNGLPVVSTSLLLHFPKVISLFYFLLNAHGTFCINSNIFFLFVDQPLFPRIPGHEGVGVTRNISQSFPSLLVTNPKKPDKFPECSTVESVGENVRGLKEGDVVMPLYLGECGGCLNCKSGKTNLCHAYPLNFNGLMPDGTSRMSVGGEKIYHHFSCSTWSEYVVIDSNYVVKVDPRMVLPHASFLACGFTTGYGAAWREVDVKKGSTVAVLGLGAVGLGVVEGARVQGAARIIGVDLNDLKREKGEAFGMTEFINPKNSAGKSVSDLLKEATGGLGVDYCFECTGVVPLLDEAIEASKVGLGTVVLIGAGLETSGNIKLIPLLCGRTLKGSIYGGVRPQSDLPTIIDKCINKEIQLDELLTHEVSIHEINKAFGLLKQPDCVKVLIKF
ncbi:hypothetical protein RJ639_025579 [Escallonia herrerae]|uniref:Alcohol dehydrogenase n=1 Tax=Escallonia herrerae TaxID=1293975 RepID=A0AA89AC03_9ASTE|nr:hypothetical protein RJ639_025579 [Escallonia herrerae]